MTSDNDPYNILQTSDPFTLFVYLTSYVVTSADNYGSSADSALASQNLRLMPRLVVFIWCVSSTYTHQMSFLSCSVGAAHLV